MLKPKINWRNFLNILLWNQRSYIKFHVIFFWIRIISMNQFIIFSLKMCIHVLTLLKRLRSTDNLVARNTTSVATIVIPKYHLSFKRTRVLWRNDWFQVWITNYPRWTWDILSCLKAKKLPKIIIRVLSKDPVIDVEGFPLPKNGTIWSLKKKMMVIDWNKSMGS